MRQMQQKLLQRRTPARFRLQTPAKPLKVQGQQSERQAAFFARHLGDDAETREVAALAASDAYLGQFQDLAGIRPELVEALQTAFPHCERPTVCQKLAIPQLLTQPETHTVVAAQTGTGKTLAYALPLLELLLRDAAPREVLRPRALVVAPSRELACQVATVLQRLAAAAPQAVAQHVAQQLRVLPLTGAMALRKVRDALARRPVDIVVATPGMVHWMLSRASRVSLRRVAHVVVDEADVCFDRDYEQDMRPLVEALQRLRERYAPSEPAARFVLVGATFPLAVHRRLEAVFGGAAGDGLARAVAPAVHRVLRPLHHRFVHVPSGGNKHAALLAALRTHCQSDRRIIVFCNTRRTCERIAAWLADQGFSRTFTPTRRIAGRRRMHFFPHQSLKSRSLGNDSLGNHSLANDSLAKSVVEDSAELLALFSSSAALPPEHAAGPPLILVTTDLGSRGLDTVHVTHVVNYDFPMTSMDFIHRVGRTARAGRRGKALTLVARRERRLVDSVRQVLSSG